MSLPETPQVVGTIHSSGALKKALQLRRGQVDLLELRVDHFASDPDVLLKVASRLAAPLIVTVRHPTEGGANSLSKAHRRELFRLFLPVAAFVDLELRSGDDFEEVVETARDQGTHVIFSDHHFRSTPSPSRLRERLALARKLNAGIFKLAAFASNASDLAVLLELLVKEKRQPMSIMGMGPFGKVSRLLFARAGSLLNYGYLDKPQVSGQWEATLLKARIGELE